VPVNLLPPVEPAWPAHLEPIGGDKSPAGRELFRESRAYECRKPPLPWQTRRRLYLAATYGPDDTRRADWARGLRRRKRG
jgi:hypothetical protein